MVTAMLLPWRIAESIASWEHEARGQSRRRHGRCAYRGIKYKKQPLQSRYNSHQEYGHGHRVGTCSARGAPVKASTALSTAARSAPSITDRAQRRRAEGKPGRATEVVALL
eukprot:3321781-Rhodomonas_salina.1